MKLCKPHFILHVWYAQRLSKKHINRKSFRPTNSKFFSIAFSKYFANIITSLSMITSLFNIYIITFESRYRGSKYMDEIGAFRKPNLAISTLKLISERFTLVSFTTEIVIVVLVLHLKICYLSNLDRGERNQSKSLRDQL